VISERASAGLDASLAVVPPPAPSRLGRLAELSRAKSP
jgi:hypothetical protein